MKIHFVYIAIIIAISFIAIKKNDDITSGPFFAYIEEGSDIVTFKKGYNPNVEWQFDEANFSALPFIKGSRKLLVAVNAITGDQWIWDNDFWSEGYHVSTDGQWSSFPKEFRSAARNHNNGTNKNLVFLATRYPKTW